MKQSTILNKKLKGFTLIELMVVIAIIGLLSGAAYFSTTGSKADARYSQAEQELTKYYPETLQRLLVRNSSCASLDKSDFTTAGLKTLNTFGNTWTVSAATATTVTISYPMLSASDATSMASEVSGGFIVNSATPSASNLTVTYSCL